MNRDKGNKKLPQSERKDFPPDPRCECSTCPGALLRGTGSFGRTSWLILLFFIFLIDACTHNPFNEGTIKGDASSVSGRIVLPEGASPESVFVWLEGVRAFTFSGRGGEFQLHLPPNLRMGSVPSSGVFRLFFYIANYGIAFRKVALRNGYFVYGNRDISGKGELLEPVRLFKILEIRTTVQPETVLVNYSGRIWVKAEFFTPQDTVDVVFPRSDGTLLGAVLLQNTATGGVIPVLSAYPEETEFTVEATPELKSLVRIFTLQSYPLAPGTYRVVPYLFVRQEGLPPELLADLLQLTPARYQSYLHIPFRRQEAYLYVEGISSSLRRAPASAR